MRISTKRRSFIHDKNHDKLTVDNALTVETGDLTLTTGDLVLTAGDITQTGDQAITGNLVVTGNISGTGDITRTGDSTITGDITGTGAITRTGDSTITGDVLGTGDITRVGNLTLTGSAGVSIAPVSADTGVEMKMICKQILHTTDSTGITETLTAAIPANSYVIGVQSKIKVTVTVTNSLASFKIGITGDTDRFGDHTALTKNDEQNPSDHEVEAHGAGRYYNAATDILLTGNTGEFAGGVVSVNVFYFDLSPPDNFA